MKAYLLAFNPQVVPRQTILNFLDTRAEVLNWMAILAGGILVISEQTAQALSALIRQQHPQLWFIVTEIPRGMNDGFLSKTAWDFINAPRSSGRWTP